MNHVSNIENVTLHVPGLLSFVEQLCCSTALPHCSYSLGSLLTSVRAMYLKFLPSLVVSIFVIVAFVATVPPSIALPKVVA